MSDVKMLFKKGIVWQKAKGENGKWYTDFNGERFTLQMNDFPDEPLFTVFSDSDAVNFDDPPLMWFIPYE